VFLLNVMYDVFFVCHVNSVSFAFCFALTHIIGIPMVLHIFLTFIPMMAGVPTQLGETRAPPPIGGVTPFIRFDTGANAAVMYLTIDDIFRAVLMMVLFLGLFPFSIANAARKRWFSITQWIHMVAACIFTIDMIRRSPHAQVFSPL
jgi:hypothetical protein